MQGRQAVSLVNVHAIKQSTQHDDVVIVVNLLTLRHYQGTDLEYSFIIDFHHQLSHESLIIARFLAVGMGSAYMWDGL